MGADADVGAVSEAEMAPGSAPRVESFGIRVFAFVAIRGGVEKEDALSRLQGLPVENRLAGDGARHELGRHVEAQRLGEGAGDRIGMGGEVRALVGGAVQPEERRRDHLRRRIRPADHERLQVGRDLEIGESATADLEVDEHIGDARLAPSAAAQRDPLGQIGVHFHRCSKGIGRAALVAGAVLGVAVDPADEQRSGLIGKREQPTGDDCRDGIGELAHDVELAPLTPRRESLAHFASHERLERQRARAAEHAANRLAKAGVHRAIHLVDARNRGLDLRERLRGGRAARGHERLDVLGRLPDVLEARERPGVVLREMVGGRLVSETAVERKRIRHDFGEEGAVAQAIGHCAGTRFG